MVHSEHEDRAEDRQEAQPFEDQGTYASADSHALSPKYAEDEQGAPVEPYFPTEDEAVELNQAAIAAWHKLYGDSPEWGGVLKPNELNSAINAAKQHYAYGPETDDDQRYVQGLAKMAWRIGGNQVFANGNKRTAIWLTRHALDQAGLGHLSPVDAEDPEFADHMIAQDSYGANVPEGLSDQQYTNYLSQQRERLEQEYLNMWNQRYQRGGMDPMYESQYPDGTYLFPKQANILDPIHDELEPAVWDDPAAALPVLKPIHSAFLHEDVFNALAQHGYEGMEKWLSLVFTGSLTTYQYSDDSDVDISLFVDTEVFPDWSRAEMIGIMIEYCDGKKLPGTPHPLQFFVVSPKLKKEDLYKPGLRSGYDMSTDTWIVPPDRSRVHDVEREMNESYTIALENADKMEKLLRYEPDKAVMFWHQIHKRRMRDQTAGKGDYSPSNVTYKMLANRGLFPKIEEVSGEHIA